MILFFSFYFFILKKFLLHKMSSVVLVYETSYNSLNIYIFLLKLLLFQNTIFVVLLAILLFVILKFYLLLNEIY